VSGGWGLGPWGVAPWGTGIFEPLRLLRAIAVRDNTVRLVFNQPPLFTGVLDDGDASDPEKYSVTGVVGTIGADELPPKAVTPVVIERPIIADVFETVLDVVVDRPFSPYPCEYLVAVYGIRAVSGMLLDPSYASFQYFGLSRGLPTQIQDESVASRDIANVQTTAATIGSISTPVNSLVLGTIGIDAQGDLATDNGMIGYQKRVARRIMTVQGGFAHLPEYGVGVPSQLKQLSSPGVRETLAADAESQIMQEPETKSVTCTFVRDSTDPNLYWLQVRAITVYGDDVSIDVPFVSVG